MALAFRNVDVGPADPVRTWPAEAVRAAVERGGLSDWRRLAADIAADPWGPVARRVEEAIIDPPYGSGPLMAAVLAVARERAEAAERRAVALEVVQLISRSGLTRSQFASGIGTSASRLSTYVGGTVVPSAALLFRMRRVASSAPDQR